MKVMAAVSRGIDKWEIRKGKKVEFVELCSDHFAEMRVERIELGKAFGSEKEKEFRGLNVKLGGVKGCLVCWDLGKGE